MLSLQTSPLSEDPNVLRPIILNGVYEDEYIKENGKWKIKKLYYNTTFCTTLEDGWVKKPVLLFAGAQNPQDYIKSINPDQQGGYGDRTYVSGYRVPFHYQNPVTGSPQYLGQTDVE